ncbi:unnamed protein product, partial [Scytosiphon promiscuus]
SRETALSGVGGGSRSLGQTGEVLTKKDRLQVFGIDCTGPFGDGIIFKGGEWVPGGEYVQRLRVKNVSPKLKKLKYRLPTTKYFSLAYPEVITLSPGTMQEVDVVFRPLSCEVYDDVILFKVLDGPNAGGFNVPVRALLPTLQVDIPVGLDFGYCQADDVSKRVFLVQNTGEVPAPFQWTTPPPFTMSPPEGVVAVGESMAVTCSITPDDASVFVSQAALRVGQGVNAIKPKPLMDMKVSAIGKYCHVVPSEDELDFGDQTIVAEFTLRNQSVVPATFTIRRLEEDRDAVFSVDPSDGVIPPEDEVVVTATFSPASAGTFSRDHYEIRTVGGNKVTVGIQGRAVGCPVRLEKKEDPFARGCGVPDSVNFREVKVGVTTTRVINLYNQASTPCRFCFIVQGERSIFRFSRTRGSIPSAGSEHPGEAQVTLTFTPTKPTNYYRRMFCLLENQQPLVLDLMGTSYVVARGEVQEQRPAPLRHAHVQAFRNRENVGLGRCSPEELDDLLGAQGMSDLFAKTDPGTLPVQRCGLARPLTRSGEATRVQTAVAAEFFVDPTDPFLNGVCLDRFSVDFGFASTGGQEIVSLTNNTDTEARLKDTPPPAWRHGGEDGPAGLQITPSEARVRQGASLSFRVEVSPTKSNCYFAEEAEAFVSPANQMTFRTVKDATQQPPWCLPLQVLGHTFIGEQFLAKASLSTQHTGLKLSFPPCHVGDTVYQTVRLLNQGNIPACFSFQSDPSGVFDVKPAKGLVQAGDFQLCLVRFTPPGPGGHHHLLECVLNNDPGSKQQAHLLGQGAWPAIEVTAGGGRSDEMTVAVGGIDRVRSQEVAGAVAADLGSADSIREASGGDGRSVIYMRPTCVGIVSSGVVKVKNASRVPVIFSIEPPDGSSGVIRVSPLAGLLLGNQSTSIQIVFAPRETKGYRFKLPVKVRSILGETPYLTDCRQLGEAIPADFKPGACVTVLGQGEKGAVMFHPESLAYSVRLVNTPESKTLVLENCSECDVKYKLFYIANKEPPLRRCSKGETQARYAGIESEDSGRLGRELRPVPKENGEAKGQGGPNTHVLLVDRPEGTLPARRTIATFRPVSEGEYDFAILCQVSTIVKAEDGNEMSPLETDMAEQGRKARASAARLEGAGSAAPLSATASDGRANGSMMKGIMPLRCGVNGRQVGISLPQRDTTASFPTVVFRDVRMTGAAGQNIRGASPRNLWSAFSLSRINAMLSKPLTDEEVMFNQARDRSESSPETSRLPRFDVPFFPSVIGKGPVVITLQVSNPGFLPTSLTVKLPNAKPVEMETWANEGEPTADELRQNEIIDRLKAFTLTPEPGTVIEVSAGEGRPLSIAYSADSLSYGGVHDLPVLVSIKEGRHFWLDLKGTTVPPQTSLLYIPTGLRRNYVLEPVAVGTPLIEAPLQTTELLNVGEAAMRFKVDAQGIKRANASQGHGMPVFRLENETGTIPSGGSVFLRWRFLPLEAKEYVLRVIVRTMEQQDDEAFGERFGEQPEEQSLDITVKGVGYDPRARDPHSEKLPAVDLGLVHPARQLEITRGQPCVLGSERLRLGRIPQGAVLSRLISVRNCLSTSAVEFSWDPEDTGINNPLISSGVVSIQPFKGRMDAAQSMLFHVTVSAECGPRFLGQQPLACLVHQEPPTTSWRVRPRSYNTRESPLCVERSPVCCSKRLKAGSHMAETARALSTRQSNISDDRGRALYPAYPASTLNAPVPRVLAEARKAVARRDRSGAPASWEEEEEEGRGGDAGYQRSMGSSKGAKSDGSGGPVTTDMELSHGRKTGGVGAGQLSPDQAGKSFTPADSAGGRTEQFSSRGGGRPGTTRGGDFLLRVDVEGEVVCTETFHALFGGRGCEENQGKGAAEASRDQTGAGKDTDDRSTVHGDIGANPVTRTTTVPKFTTTVVTTVTNKAKDGTGMDRFVVPRPSPYVPDWAAFGCQDGANGSTEKGMFSAGPSGLEEEQQRLSLLKRASEDPLASDVASRVLKRLMRDVVTCHGIRESLNSLPTRARVPTFSEVMGTPSLTDRVVAVVAPHLQAYVASSTPAASRPPLLTPAATAVSVLPVLNPGGASSDGGRTKLDRPRCSAVGATVSVNSRTPVRKEDLLTALRAVGAVGGIKTARANKSGGAPSGSHRKESPLAKGLLAAIEACGGTTVTIQGVAAALDNSTVVRLETWLDQKKSPEAQTEDSMLTFSGLPTEAAATATLLAGVADAAQRNANARDGHAERQMDVATGPLPPPATGDLVAEKDSQEGRMATAIQAQARRRQAVQTAQEKSRKRLLGLVDKASQDRDTQRIVAAVLEGTFFNLMQEAYDGKFKLSKRPTRYAIRKRSAQRDRASDG